MTGMSNIFFWFFFSPTARFEIKSWKNKAVEVFSFPSSKSVSIFWSRAKPCSLEIDIFLYVSCCHHKAINRIQCCLFRCWESVNWLQWTTNFWLEWDFDYMVSIQNSIWFRFQMYRCNSFSWKEAVKSFEFFLNSVNEFKFTNIFRTSSRKKVKRLKFNQLTLRWVVAIWMS